MEIYIKKPSSAFLREIKDFFRGEIKENVTVVLCLQDSSYSFIEVRGDEAKDVCLEIFFEFAEILRGKLGDYWSDYIDPSSGLAVKNDSCRAFNDVETCIRLLKMEYVSCGGCGMVKHPSFGYAVYPSTFFTTAEIDIVFNILKEIVSEGRWKNVDVYCG